jgi:hypothetical protein
VQGKLPPVPVNKGLTFLAPIKNCFEQTHLTRFSIYASHNATEQPL